jgi:exopolysaccharide biosynthesis polyprenyl glycosylphosphotransferase
VALEVDQPQPAAAGAAISHPPLTRRRFALSIRERRVLLAASDFAVGAIACVIAYAFLHRLGNRPLELPDVLIVAAVWVISLLITDGYAFQIPSSRAESGFAVLRALPITALLTVLLFFIRPYVLTRPVIVGAIVIGAALIIAVRITLDRLLLHESLALQALLVADTEPSADIVATLRAARFEYRVVGTLVRRADDEEERAQLVSELRDLIQRTRAEEVVVTNNEVRLVPGVVEECLTHGVRIVSAGDLVERYVGRVPIESVDVHWYLGLPDSDVWKRPYAVARRIFDLLVSTIVSLPFLILLPILALLIRLDSSGPVFLVQRRIGERGREFDIIKLRTMKADAEAGGAQYASKRDPRVTRVGRFLRASRLDEFPQLLNILRGDMSFIGPRPERPEFEADLEAKIPHFRSRLLMKPGLTGWAQIKGGYASTIPEMTRKLEYDLFYIKNRSFRLDLQILARTFTTVLGWKGR